MQIPIGNIFKNIVASLNADLASTSQGQTKFQQMQIEDEWSEACVVVTNKGVYIISLK